MIIGSYGLESVDPTRVQDLLYEHKQFKEEADAISHVINMTSNHPRPIGYSSLLPHARVLATSQAMPEYMAPDAKQTYAQLQELHEEQLSGMARSVTDLLTRRPGVLHISSALSASEREPLVRLEYVEARAKPHAEATIAMYGLHGIVHNLHDADVRCDVTKFPKKIRRQILQSLIAGEV